MTASKAPCCAKCFVEQKQKTKRAEEHAFIESFGYSNVHQVGYSSQGKPQWKFTHECGTEQVWVFNNFLTRAKADPNTAPCSKCGGKRRMDSAMQAFIAKYGITEEQMIQYERYSKKVRHLSDKVYKLHEQEINPLGLKRGMYDYHLDHIMPIIQGFKQGLAPEFMARKENLQMLPAKDNLSKARK